MRLLHLASFTGNIGDNISHWGTYSILRRFTRKLHLNQLEMRKFYNNYNLPDRFYFDDTFVDYANKHDLLMIGGGGFLDHFLENSMTGTTIDITQDRLAQIKIPILFCGIGSLPRGGNKECFAKAQQFLDVLRRKAVVLMRNDGSVENWRGHFKFTEVLDSGFFYQNIDDFKLTNEQYIAVNVSTDLLEEEKADILTGEIAALIENIPYKVVMIPHIAKDIEAINEVLKKMHYFNIANNVIVAPYLQGFAGADKLFALYRQSRQVVATRLHANIGAITMGRPCVGIEVADRIDYLYRSVGGEPAVEIRKGMAEEIFEKFGNSYTVEKAKLFTLGVYKQVFNKILGAGK